MKSSIIIPFNFQQRIQTIHGERGKVWLSHLPDLISAYSIQWGLSIGSSLSILSNNFVLQVEDSTQNPLILKFGIRENDIGSEIIALQTFNGDGCIELIEAESKDGVMLIRRALPGTTLEEVTLNGNDDDAVLIVCRMIERMHRQSKLKKRNPLSQSLEEWSKGFQKLRDVLKDRSCPFDMTILGRAEREYQELLKSTSEPLLLHGDLHHFNILKSEGHLDSWVAIDPQGVWGDPVFDVAAFMRNPFPQIARVQDIKKLMNRRIDLFSEYLSFDKKRILAWSFAQTALASCWQYLDLGEEWEIWWTLAQVFLELEPR